VEPRVLIAATERWYPTVRVAMALSAAGCRIDAVCPSGHPLSKTGFAQSIHDYNGLMPLSSLRRAIEEANPDLIVPADDLATRHLHALHKFAVADRSDGSPIRELIERSLGDTSSFDVVRQRATFMQVAREQGIRVPETRVLSNSIQLREWISHVGFPFVLKADGTSGGDGVKVVNSSEEAERGLRLLQAPPLLARAMKRAFVDRDLTLVWPSISRSRPVVNAQKFIGGREATSTMVCWKGVVLASLHLEVVAKARSTGHATVVRLIEHSEMSAAAEKISRRLQLSGFHGLDFILESQSGNAFLIELNPRTTQVGHLALGPGRDLPAALYAALSGKVVQPSQKITDKDVIALFPQEWKRDPSSPFLSSAYHDVPWQEPMLVRECVSKLGRKSAQNAANVAPKIQPSSPSACAASTTAKGQSATWIAEQNKI
jgi:carbamoylphosphate synthase large subunit